MSAEKIVWGVSLTASQLAAVANLFDPDELKRVLELKAANNREVERLLAEDAANR